MALNQSKFNVDWCVSGEKRMQELDPKMKPSFIQNGRAMCVWCEQMNALKKDGFFKRHKASQQQYQSIDSQRSGTLPRERRTKA